MSRLRGLERIFEGFKLNLLLSCVEENLASKHHRLGQSKLLGILEIPIGATPIRLSGPRLEQCRESVIDTREHY